MTEDEDLADFDGENQRTHPTVPGCHWAGLVVPPVCCALLVTLRGGVGLFFLSWSGPGWGGKSLSAALVLVS